MIPSTNTQLLVSEDWKKIYQSFRNADFKSYDFETLRRTMISYLQENYPEDFNDFIDSSEYIALIDLIAYLGQNLSFRIDLNARENFLETAQRRDSILRLAQLISYNPARNVPASGFLKVTAVSTTDNVFDSNGVNLANTTIGWNDPTNADWYQQFVNIMNSAMTSSFGTPNDRNTIDGISTEQYRINSSNSDTPLFSFLKNINGTAMNFEIVPCTFAGKTFVYEEPPTPASSFSLLYKNDNQGSGSINTGFFTHFRQGSLSMARFSLDNPVPNEIVGVNTPDINNSDVWLWQLDKNGEFDTLWTQVPSLIGNNVIYNSLNKNLRTIYAVSSRDEDEVDLNFADGIFGDLPKGDFRLFYRQSNGLTYVIKPEQMSGVIITIPYTNAIGQNHSLQLSLSLQYNVSNSSGPETNSSIQLKAPQSYYTQNRMITGEDYNIAPLTAGPDILKIKSVNRVSSGLSKYFDLSDVSGKYSKTNIFANDGILYKELKENSTDLIFSARSQVLSFVKNTLGPIVDATDVRSLYFDNYPRIGLTFTDLSWIEVNKAPSESRGYFVSTGNVPVAAGRFSQSNLQYVSPGSIVKFIPPTGFYFDQRNNLTQNVGKTYIWSTVKQVIGDGFNSGIGTLDDGTGPVIFSTKVPSGATPVSVISRYTNSLGFSIENEIANMCMAQRNFGITIDSTSRTWSIILSSNLNTTSPYSISNQNNVDELGLDASWIIAFIWTGKGYNVRYRTLKYVFESEKETAFFIDKTSINYDFSSNTVIKDKIDVLSINSEPTATPVWYGGPSNPASSLVAENGSFYLNTTTNVIFKKVSGVWVQGSSTSNELGVDFSWQIDKSITEIDGYVQPKKVEISFYDDQGQINDPDSFINIVGNEFVYFKKRADGLRYDLTSGITPFQTEAEFNAYRLGLEQNNLTVADGDLFYFYDPSIDAVKYWSAIDARLLYTDQYFGRRGRANLKFHYMHNSGQERRVDPSKSNIIDIYVLTTSYDNAVRSWLSGASSEPLAPTSQSLNQSYTDKLELIKAISDEIVFHPVKYKILFGSNADVNLQATFKASKNPNKTTTDNDLSTRILAAINEFFALENWEFGQSFYFSELSTYVMNQLSPDITNFVIVPKGNVAFGSYYEIACQSNELFISGATISDIEIIDSVTSSQIKSSTSIVTTSGT
jgi:hypothetical protein